MIWKQKRGQQVSVTNIEDGGEHTPPSSLLVFFYR